MLHIIVIIFFAVNECRSISGRSFITPFKYHYFCYLIPLLSKICIDEISSHEESRDQSMIIGAFMVLEWPVKATHEESMVTH